MRYIGKYEKNPPVQKNVSPGLQTYLASLMSLLLCVSMFFGTTFAWFTSNVVNSGNEIYIGTLQADLLLGGVSLKDNPTTKVYDNTIHWQPGTTVLRTLMVENKGDLDFTYELTFTDGAVAGGTAADIAQYFEVYVIVGEADPSTTIDQIRDDTSQWSAAASLATILNGQPLMSGTIQKEDGDQAQTNTITVALHMKEETVDSSIMGKSLTLSVKLTAWQKDAPAPGV